MAPEMQFTSNMTRALASLLSLILTASFTTSVAFADEDTACVKAFSRANDEYFKSHADIESRQTDSMIVAGVAGTAAVGCMALRRSIVGFVGCGALGTAMGGGAAYYSTAQESKLQRLFDGYRLYQAYYSTIDEAAEPSEHTEQFVKDLGVDVNKEKEALKEMAGLMRWGALCEGEQTKSYDEVLELMKARLHAPQ